MVRGQHGGCPVVVVVLAKVSFVAMYNFGMRRRSSTVCRGASRKEPQQYVSLVRALPNVVGN